MRIQKRLRHSTFTVVLLVFFTAIAVAQEETRPSGTTFLGDTGLWFVPTAEVLDNGSVAAAGHISTFNYEQGFTAVQSVAGSFAVGIGERAEFFGSIGVLTRIDRDLRPLFQSGQANVGGAVVDYPLANSAFSGNKFGDVVVGIKANVLSERQQAPLALAVRGWVKLPTGDKKAGTTSGELDGAVGLVMSKALGGAEVAIHSDFVLRKDTAGIELPNSIQWGFGVGTPVRGPIRVFGEVLGDVLTTDSLKLSTPLTGTDGSISGLSLSHRSPLDLVVGVQWQHNGFSLGSGLTWAARHTSRSLVGQIIPQADRIGFIARLSYHPGVRVYVPPPPDEPNQPPTVTISCEPCEVEFGEEVRLRADATDPDGDALNYRWNAPTGSFQDSADRATTRWTAPDQAGPVPVSVTVTDGLGGSASDTANIQVSAPPPAPVREYVFEDVHFDFDRYNLRPAAARVLDDAIAALQEDPNLQIEIEGHTCNIGTNEYNLALGDRRANSVQDYLTDRGVGANRLRTISYGEERAKHDNSREETRRLNRRAALVVRVQ
ncbi:MAG: OmpA family protein [Acidobacteriota bacterium]|nr:OmpA family protein [Acidobacteriota bacterium]